jgi:hypothetical protein
MTPPWGGTRTAACGVGLTNFTDCMFLFAVGRKKDSVQKAAHKKQKTKNKKTQKQKQKQKTNNQNKKT